MTIEKFLLDGEITTREEDTRGKEKIRIQLIKYHIRNVKEIQKYTANSKLINIDAEKLKLRFRRPANKTTERVRYETTKYK